jgi:Fe-S-cluster containining protein
MKSGLWATVLREIELRSRHEDRRCVLRSETPVSEGGGFCRAYSWRPLICRVFGWSVVKDKRGEGIPFACEFIKKKYSPAFLGIEGAPVLSRYYSQLFAIDPSGSLVAMPINLAISGALENLFFYYRYRGLTVKM